MSEIAVRVHPAVGVRSGFFFAAHCALLAVVLVGFGRTFYLRAFFDTGPLPAQLYVHGAILTLWFSFAVAQAMDAYSIFSVLSVFHTRLERT